MGELTTTTLQVQTINGPERVTGVLLGHSTSERGQHNHTGDFSAPGGDQRCSACRWMEVDIVYDEASEEYAVVVQGRSAVPGEIDRCRVERTTSAIWVIETLQMPKRRVIPKTAMRAITAAARFDADLADALARRQQVVG
jgi:hypothetical protein